MKNQTAHSTNPAQGVLNLEAFKANRFLEDGKYHISQGDLAPAIECLKKSINALPNSEAYTYLAWVLSMEDDFDTAINLCKEAIKINPQIGTPWNDIGNYLIQKGDLEEAIPWLEKAKMASNYDTPHFPYINLGRVYSVLGRFEEAIREFKSALKISPGHHEVQKVLEELEEIQNNA